MSTRWLPEGTAAMTRAQGLPGRVVVQDEVEDARHHHRDRPRQVEVRTRAAGVAVVVTVTVAGVRARPPRSVP
ncbi:hypothetical protein [Streptomyces sp. NPDC001480]|uniref:hypothetical protein n=1 Tax=Streptomyces sp. NPDC001480 TaxID=3364577 RepID=UPI00369BD74E